MKKTKTKSNNKIAKPLEQSRLLRSNREGAGFLSLRRESIMVWPFVSGKNPAGQVYNWLDLK